MQNSIDAHRVIEKEAYELYVQRGRLDGDDLADWFQAEEMMYEKSSPVSGDGKSERKMAAIKPKRGTKAPN